MISLTDLHTGQGNIKDVVCPIGGKKPCSILKLNGKQKQVKKVVGK